MVYDVYRWPVLFTYGKCQRLLIDSCDTFCPLKCISMYAPYGLSCSTTYAPISLPPFLSLEQWTITVSLVQSVQGTKCIIAVTTEWLSRVLINVSCCHRISALQTLMHVAGYKNDLKCQHERLLLVTIGSESHPLTSIVDSGTQSEPRPTTSMAGGIWELNGIDRSLLVLLGTHFPAHVFVRKSDHQLLPRDYGPSCCKATNDVDICSCSTLCIDARHLYCPSQYSSTDVIHHLRRREGVSGTSLEADR